MTDATTPKEACSNCRFRFLIPQDMKAVMCRRHPPFPMVQPVQVPPTPANPNGIGMQLVAHFPVLKGDQWCGEYRAMLELVK
jgi:hypothetical protein